MNRFKGPSYADEFYLCKECECKFHYEDLNEDGLCHECVIMLADRLAEKKEKKMNKPSPLPNKLNVKSVVELFENHPERWCKGAYNRNEKGFGFVSEETACQWCLAGAVKMIYGDLFYQEFIFDGAFSLVIFNDNDAKSVEDVINKARELEL